MTSKEKIEALNYIWFYEPNCQEDVDKREAIIKELKKDLEILEEIRNTFKVEKEETINQNHYWLIVKKKPYYSYMITKEQYNKWKGWLGNAK